MEPIFDHEKLDVYGLELQLTRLVERFDPEEFRIREDGPQFETRLP